MIRCPSAGRPPSSQERSRKLDGPGRERIAKRLHDVAGDPRRYLTRLAPVEAYLLRVGDYRPIVDAGWGRQVVCMGTLDHRSTVYR